MTAKYRDDLTLPLVQEADARGPRRTSIAAFVPITLALIGIGMILFGGLSARDPATAIGAVSQVDPIATGSIAPRDNRHDLEMLDR